MYLFLAGMMLLAELARNHGVFDWLAAEAMGHARDSQTRLFVLVYGIGIVVTALLSNDATAVLLTPAVLAVVRRAKTSPLPYLFACAFIANAASFRAAHLESGESGCLRRTAARTRRNGYESFCFPQSPRSQ